MGRRKFREYPDGWTPWMPSFPKTATSRSLRSERKLARRPACRAAGPIASGPTVRIASTLPVWTKSGSPGARARRLLAGLVCFEQCGCKPACSTSSRKASPSQGQPTPRYASAYNPCLSHRGTRRTSELSAQLAWLFALEDVGILKRAAAFFASMPSRWSPEGVRSLLCCLAGQWLVLAARLRRVPWPRGAWLDRSLPSCPIEACPLPRGPGSRPRFA